jgi:hypothetical protein
MRVEDPIRSLNFIKEKKYLFTYVIYYECMLCITVCIHQLIYLTTQMVVLDNRNSKVVLN